MGDLIMLGFVLASSILGGILVASIVKRGIVTSEEFEMLFTRVLAEIEAHRKDHSVRAYNPKQVGVQLATLTASITQLDNLLRERIGRNAKSASSSRPRPLRSTTPVEPAGR